MILRVYRARAAADSRGLLLAHLRDRVYPANVGIPGLRTFQAGIAELPGGLLELAVVSTWQDFEAMRAGLGDEWLRPAWLAEVATQLAPVAADHYELVGEELTGIVPLAGGALRLLSGRLASGSGEGFFEFARRAQTAQLDAGDILVSHIGRRIVDEGEDAAFVAVWRDADAAATAGGTATTPANRDLWEPYFDSWMFNAYDAIARVPEKRAQPHGLLLADDDRRLLFASAGAARLLGRSPARLMGRRVEELAVDPVSDDVDALWREFVRNGSQAGPFALARGDGSVVTVSYEARANTPWPGVHASVLSDPTTPADFDDALASAGIIARYGVAEPA
jgi:PAS domain-containing protein